MGITDMGCARKRLLRIDVVQHDCDNDCVNSSCWLKGVKQADLRW